MLAPVFSPPPVPATPTRPLMLAGICLAAALLSGCAGTTGAGVSSAAGEAPIPIAAAMEGAPAPAPVPMASGPVMPKLSGRGFAQVAGQPGQTLNERRLLAMRAARLDALRDLTEQVHGIQISSDSYLRDAVLRNDTVAAHVQGSLRAARTVSIEPRGEDGYAVLLELDEATLSQVLRAAL
nr:LPP20 family lipoprotein [Paracoccus saliphilus]